MLRTFHPQDAEALASVYRDSVRVIGPQTYTPEEVEAWAKYPEDIEDFRSRMSHGLTLVAEERDRIIAFGQLEPDDHLAFLYCAGRHCRKGIGSEIYCALEAHAFQKGILQISTDASRISRPFFAKHGYAVVGVERVIRFGVEFERFRMMKKKGPTQSPEPTSGLIYNVSQKNDFA
jgi:putative acetyltransferase